MSRDKRSVAVRCETRLAEIAASLASGATRARERPQDTFLPINCRDGDGGGGGGGRGGLSFL